MSTEVMSTEVMSGALRETASEEWVGRSVLGMPPGSSLHRERTGGWVFTRPNGSQFGTYASIHDALVIGVPTITIPLHEYEELKRAIGQAPEGAE